MRKSTLRNLLLFGLDMCVAVLCFLITYYITRSQLTTRAFLECLGLLFVVYGVSLLSFGTYRSLWRHAQTKEYFLIHIASILAGAVYFIICRAIVKEILPLYFYCLLLLTVSTALITTRLVYRIYRDFVCRRREEKKLGKGRVLRRTMIIGAGSACRRLLSDLHDTPASEIDPVVLVDDNPELQNHVLRGIPVAGTSKDIPELVKKFSVELIVIAIPSATNEQRSVIIDACRDTVCPVKILPRLSELSDTSMLQRLRDISMDELLGREPFTIEDETVFNFVSGKTVLVTGGGGSIGSELSRQIAAHRPKRLIIIDIYENNAYAIQQELIRKYGDALDLSVIIGSVRDKYWLMKTVAELKPDIVFHAAAHKHVPLMEVSPAEAVKNNILGTWNAVRAAADAGVGTFVLISTDKAVNPTNIMGATKRACEMIIQSMNGTCDTRFVAVRFGNVLGSNGSVIPLFKKQIAEGGPVTVTHPDIIRYFMTIPEAAQLVITAASMAKGGEIFVLDMGNPVRIDDLARKMIRLAGLVPDKDIPVIYTGLRPGEKLYEELLMGEEGMRMTPNKKIFIGNPLNVDRASFFCELDGLKQFIYGLDRNDDMDRPAIAAAVETRLMQMVPTFRRVPQKSAAEALGSETVAAAKKYGEAEVLHLESQGNTEKQVG